MFPPAPPIHPAAPAAPTPLRRGWLQAWFAPLAAAAVVVLSLGTAWSPGDHNPVATTAYAAMPAEWGPSGIEQNALPRPTFPSTPVAASLAAGTFGSLLLRQTNVLAR